MSPFRFDPFLAPDESGWQLMAHAAKRRKSISPIFENAIDSLRIGMEFSQRESSYSSHKHAILTVFHAIELLLKEQLHRTNPVLIYKNIDKKVRMTHSPWGLPTR